ncbi:MAG: hypothetical protein ACKO2N_14360 [Tabrizicola sp.]
MKLQHLSKMLKSEDGAVSVDFVVLTAAAVVVAMLIYPMLSSPVSDLAESIGDQVSSYTDYFN